MFVIFLLFVVSPYIQKIDVSLFQLYLPFSYTNSLQMCRASLPPIFELGRNKSTLLYFITKYLI